MFFVLKVYVIVSSSTINFYYWIYLPPTIIVLVPQYFFISDFNLPFLLIISVSLQLSSVFGLCPVFVLEVSLKIRLCQF